jgi:hypothetical protein
MNFCVGGEVGSSTGRRVGVDGAGVTVAVEKKRVFGGSV